jgi:hypothetical protein
MGIAHRYLGDVGLLVTVWDGQVSAAEWLALARRHVSEPGFAAGTRRLTDATTADISAITPADVEAVTAIYHEHDFQMQEVRLAIVARAGFEIAQRAERDYSELGARTIVFVDLIAACDWLGVDPDVVAPAIAAVRADLRTGEPGAGTSR